MTLDRAAGEMPAAKPVKKFGAGTNVTTGSVKVMWYILFFLSGFSSLLFEIVWQRAFHLAFGASAPAIVAVLTAFFVGDGFGMLARPRADGAGEIGGPIL